MNTAAPTLAPLFRSNMQGELLAKLFLNAERSFTIAELARAAHSSYASAHREVSRLADMALVTTEKRGQAVDVRARQDAPAFRPLSELLNLTYGPAVAIPNHLASVPAIAAAYIFGSWAARLSGEPGDSPADIDLLIIGNPPRDELHEATRRASSAVGREVNPHVVSSEQWANADSDRFLRTVKERPLVRLDLMPPY